MKTLLLAIATLALWTGTAGAVDSYTSNDKLTSGYDASCIIKSSTLYCWGPNTMGAVGDGTTTARANTNMYQHSGTWRGVFTNWGHVCAINTSDELYCWGRNDNGQLGQGDLTDRSTPTKVGTATWSRVIVGSQHTCAIRKSPNPNTDANGNADLYCWGDNAHGQLGDGGTTDHTSPLISNIKAVNGAAGWGHTCIINATSATKRVLRCVGENNQGQLGDNTTTNNSAWQGQRKSDGSGLTMDYVRSVSANTYQTCVTGGLSTDNTELRCWGYNSNGAAGGASGTYIPYVPTTAECMPSLNYLGYSAAGWNRCSGFTAVSVGYLHVVALWDAVHTSPAYDPGVLVTGLGWGSFDQFAQYGGGSGFYSVVDLSLFDEPDGSCFGGACGGVAGYTGSALGVAGGWYRSFAYYYVTYRAGAPANVHAFREYGTDVAYPSQPTLQLVIDAQGWEY